MKYFLPTIISVFLFGSLSPISQVKADFDLKTFAAERRSLRSITNDAPSTSIKKTARELARLRANIAIISPLKVIISSRNSAVSRENNVIHTTVATVDKTRVIEHINQIRRQNNSLALKENARLTKVTERLQNHNFTAYSQTDLIKQLELVNFQFPKSVTECNCEGTSDSFQLIVLRSIAGGQSIANSLDKYRDTLISDEYSVYGISEKDSVIYLLIAGTTMIPVEPFTAREQSEYRQEILYLTNIERAKEGLKPLAMNAILEKTAQQYAERMWNEKFYGHVDPAGGILQDRVDANNYFDFDFTSCNCAGVNFAVGENIAKGQKTAKEVMTDWMNSPGHRKNIVSPDFTEIGIGVYGNRWVQNFGAVIVQ